MTKESAEAVADMVQKSRAHAAHDVADRALLILDISTSSGRVGLDLVRPAGLGSV